MTLQNASAEDCSESSRHLIELSRHLINRDEEARRELAATLHNLTTPNLAAIALHLGMLSADALTPRQCELLADMRTLLDDTITSLRELSSDLRPPLLDYVGLVPALAAYVRRFSERTGIAVGLNGVPFRARLPPDREILIFRLVQEALASCARQALATTIEIDLTATANTVTLSVRHNGTSFTPDQPDGTEGSPGLFTMLAMSELAGGQFFSESLPGQGRAIRVEMPIH
jgi:signal transduction histidine kinase